MSSTEINSKVKELRELRRMADEIAAEIDSIQDAIKKEMTARNVEEMTGDDYKITWKSVVSRRFDSTAFRSTHSELFNQYTKESVSRRFVLA